MAKTAAGQSSLVITEGIEMDKRTLFSTGGKAEYYAEPRNPFDALSVLEIAYKKGLDVTIMGSGTHVLVSDEGIPGLVLSTSSMKGISIKGSLLIASPGEMLENVINKSIDHNLTGLENLAGIPGTIGGALALGATALSTSISDVLFYADYMTKDGHIIRRPSYQAESGSLIISIAFLLTPHRASAEARVRKETNVELMFIPPLRGFSSRIFRDPEGKTAAAVIAEAGLAGPNGTKAEFSEYESNSIATYPGCTSNEIYALIKKAEKETDEKLGIHLEPSISLLGSFRSPQQGRQ